MRDTGESRWIATQVEPGTLATPRQGSARKPVIAIALDQHSEFSQCVVTIEAGVSKTLSMIHKSLYFPERSDS